MAYDKLKRFLEDTKKSRKEEGDSVSSTRSNCHGKVVPTKEMNGTGDITLSNTDIVPTATELSTDQTVAVFNADIFDNQRSIRRSRLHEYKGGTASNLKQNEQSRPTTKATTEVQIYEPKTPTALPERKKEVNTPVRRPRNKKAKTTQDQNDDTLVDPVIEQWYTDPYNRYDPERSTGNQLRKEVLTTALRNRGFRGGRIVSIVNWLVHCNGIHKDYNEHIKSNYRKPLLRGRDGHSRTPRTLETRRNRSSKQRPRLRPATPVKDHIAEPGKTGQYSTTSVYPSPASNRSESVLETINNETEDHNPVVNTPAISTVSEGDEDGESISEKEQQALQQLTSEIAAHRSSFRSTHPRGSQAYRDEYEDWLLERLERTQAFWNIIYGDDLDDVPDHQSSEAVKFTYFRHPEGLPTVDVRYQSQGLKPTKPTILKGRQVLAEDDTFGLYIPAPSEREGKWQDLKFLREPDDPPDFESSEYDTSGDEDHVLKAEESDEQVH